MTRTPAQRLVDGGAVVLPDDCPPCVDAHTWRLLVRHIHDGVPYAALAREAAVSRPAVRARVERLLGRLRTPDLLCLPPPLWRALVGAGYTTRATIAAAPDEALLAVPGVDRAALWHLRHGRYDAPRDRAARQRFYNARSLAQQARPRCPTPMMPMPTAAPSACSSTIPPSIAWSRWLAPGPSAISGHLVRHGRGVGRGGSETRPGGDGDASVFGPNVGGSPPAFAPPPAGRV